MTPRSWWLTLFIIHLSTVPQRVSAVTFVWAYWFGYATFLHALVLHLIYCLHNPSLNTLLALSWMTARDFLPVSSPANQQSVPAENGAGCELGRCVLRPLPRWTTVHRCGVQLHPSSTSAAALLPLRALTAHMFLCCRRKRSLFLDFLQDFGFGFPSGASQQGECITAAVLWFLVHHGDLGCFRILESVSVTLASPTAASSFETVASTSSLQHR